MKHPLLSISLLLAASPQALAHGGHFHLSEETLEKVFQFMDAVYAWSIGHLPLMAGIVVGMLVLLAIGKAILTRTG